MSHDRDYYFARAPREELEGELLERVKRYYQHVQETGRLQLWRRSIRCWRGYDANGGWANSQYIHFGGEQGEEVRFRVNHYGAIGQGIHTLVTGSPPTTRAIAATTGREGEDQAAVADKLLEYDQKQQGLTRLFARAALFALHSGEGWIYQAWDGSKGRETGTQPVDAEGMPVEGMNGERPDGPEDSEEEKEEDTPEVAGERILYEGDVTTEALHPIDVWRDPDTRLGAGHPFDWIGSRRRISRWRLVAQFPEYREHLLSIDEWDVDSSSTERELFETYRSAAALKGSADKVYVYEWYHPQCPELPMGRFAWMVGGKIIWEGPYPYQRDQLPLREMMPDIEERSCFGYTPMWNLLAPQAAYDSIFSTGVSNVETFGAQNVWTRKGDPVDIDKVSSGFNNIQSNTKPEGINLTSVAEETFKFLEITQTVMELLSGANSVMRGDPDASLKSGAALALVQAVAVQHNSGHHRSFAWMVEKILSDRIKLWQSFATSNRTAEIAGEDERTAAQEWNADTISGVSRVSVEMTNPIFATSEGKRQLADNMADRGWVDRHEWLQVVKTGRFDPILKREVAERRLILRENEKIRNGEEVKALWGDRHRLHMREHFVELTDPQVRFDDQAVSRVMEHITEHRNLLFETPPELLEAIGEPPPMAMTPPPPGMEDPLAGGLPPPGPPMPPDAEPQVAPVPAVGPPGVGNPMGGSDASLPNLPNMPAAGAQVNPTAPNLGA